MTTQTQTTQDTEMQQSKEQQTATQELSTDASQTNQQGILDIDIKEDINYDINAWQKDGIVPKTIDLEDVSIKSAINSFKAANLTEDQAKKFITSYIQDIDKTIEVATKNFEEESIKVFGSKENLQQAVKTLKDFQNKLSPEQSNILKESINFNPHLAKLITDIISVPKVSNPIPSKIEGNFNQAYTRAEKQQMAIAFANKHGGLAMLSHDPVLLAEYTKIYNLPSLD